MAVGFCYGHWVILPRGVRSELCLADLSSGEHGPGSAEWERALKSAMAQLSASGLVGVSA